MTETPPNSRELFYRASFIEQLKSLITKKHSGDYTVKVNYKDSKKRSGMVSFEYEQSLSVKDDYIEYKNIDCRLNQVKFLVDELVKFATLELKNQFPSTIIIEQPEFQFEITKKN